MEQQRCDIGRAEVDGSPVTRQEKGREEVVRGDKLGCSHRTQE